MALGNLALGILALGILALGILALWVFWNWVLWHWVYCPDTFYLYPIICLAEIFLFFIIEEMELSRSRSAKVFNVRSKNFIFQITILYLHKDKSHKQFQNFDF